VVKLLIRPATPTGPGPATTSGQVPSKAQSQSESGSPSQSTVPSPTRPQDRDRDTRSQKSLSQLLDMSMSSAWSATILLRRWFSFSSSYRRLASSAFMPPYWFAPAVPGRLGDLEMADHLLDGEACALTS
jgi:hypothetical protein